MSSEEKKQYTIKFANRHFQIVSNDGDQHISDLETLLSDSYSQISNHNNSDIAQNSIKVSLKLADELVRLKRRLSNLNELLS
jgi:hypothetical protein